MLPSTKQGEPAKMKKLMVLIYNEQFTPQSSVETFWKGGVTSIMEDWTNIFSL